MRAGACGVVAAATLVLAGCGRTQNALAPKSHQARDIATLFWWMMGCAWIGLSVVSLLLVGAWRRRGGEGRGEEKAAERKGWFVVIGAGMVLTIVVLAALFVISDAFLIRTPQAPRAAAPPGE